MNPEDFQKLSDIREFVNVIKAKRDDLCEVYSMISQLLRIISEISDETIRNMLKTGIIQLQNKVTEDITQQSDKLLKYISAIVSAPAATKQKTYIDATGGISATSEYDDKKRKYSSYNDKIADVEEKIVRSFVFTKKLHEPIKHGKYAGYLHARITENLRIIYIWDARSKALIFTNILTKNELDQT